MNLGMQVGLGPGHIAFDGDPKGAQPQFSLHICCGQMAGWIKMTLGSEVGLGPRDTVLEGDPAPLPKKGAEPPSFRPMSIVAKRLDGSTGHLVRTYGSRPRPHCANGDPAPLPKKGV